MEIVTGDRIIKYVYDAINQDFVCRYVKEDILDKERIDRYADMATNSSVPVRFFDAFIKTDIRLAKNRDQVWQLIATKLINLKLKPQEAEYAVIYSCAMSLLILSGVSKGEKRVLSLADQYCRLLSGEEVTAGNFYRDKIPKEVERSFSENRQLGANITTLSRNINARDVSLYDVVVPGLEPGTSSM